MNDAPPAGGQGALEIAITRKTHAAADGTAVLAVADFTLRLPAGGFAALIGPSGCGKTTILRIVAGLDNEFAGSVRRPEPTRYAMVFQDPRLLPWRTVAQNIDLARARSHSGDTAELAGGLGLTAVLSRYPGELSLGLARRVALARAFAAAPTLLLLDEPFVSLDDASANQMRAAVADFAERTAATVLMVTHDVTEAIALADTLVILPRRPAGILGTIALPSPRGRRSRRQIETARAEVAAVQAADR